MNNKIAAGACCAALVLGAGVYFGGVIMTKHQADRMIPTALENANRQLDTKGTGLRIDYERLSDGLMSEKAKITMILGSGPQDRCEPLARGHRLNRAAEPRA